MIVITLNNCPISLRGDLTKWLLEINTGVFVGRVSARVRDNLWQRVTENVKQGQATLVYNANNEQHMEFRIHQSDNEIIDFDGMKLILKPSPSRVKTLSKKRLGFSKAAKILMAKRKRNCAGREFSKEKMFYPSNYVVLDLETSGLNPVTDEIIEIGLLKVKHNEICEKYTSLLKVSTKLKPVIVQLTGINDDLLKKEGKNITEVLPIVRDFIGDDIIVGHNISFDISFIDTNLHKQGLDVLNNITLDTMEMYTKILNGKNASRKLIDIAKNYGVAVEQIHRGLSDCEIIKNVYDVMKQFEKTD